MSRYRGRHRPMTLGQLMERNARWNEAYQQLRGHHLADLLRARFNVPRDHLTFIGVREAVGCNHCGVVILTEQVAAHFERRHPGTPR